MNFFVFIFKVIWVFLDLELGWKLVNVCFFVFLYVFIFIVWCINLKKFGFINLFIVIILCSKGFFIDGLSFWYVDR